MSDQGPLISRVAAPAVALETAFLTSGLPMEQRLAAAEGMAAAVRERNAVPAFIGVVAGRPIVGLQQTEIELLAKQDLKVSTRDLPMALARRSHGGTTVAATAFLARRAGLVVAATGGIGGVHIARGLPEALDISADLHELRRTAIVLVCSGAKAIVDLRATLERLETLGIAVIGFGTDELPAFWSPESGIRLESRVESAEEVVEIWRAARGIESPGSLLVCVPPPAEVALARDETERAVSRALSDLDMAGIKGPAVTPFLLARIAEHTQGRSLLANLGLLANNAAVAASIVNALEATAR
ncbi:MAG: pseudouridine-5'-phosphate glycosidase [Gemmatimonadales bacterium]